MTASESSSSKFRLFPPHRSYEDYPWPIWAMGLLAVFKSLLWISYGTRYGWGIPDGILELILARFVILTIPFLVLGMGVWNMRGWALKGLVVTAILDLAVSLLLLVTYSGLYATEPVVSQNLLFRAILFFVTPIMTFRDPIIDMLLIGLAFPVRRILRTTA